MGRISDDERQKLLEKRDRYHESRRREAARHLRWFSPFAFAFLAGVAAWWGVRYWTAATFGLGAPIAGETKIDGTIEQAAVGVGIAVWLGVSALVLAIRELRG